MRISDWSSDVCSSDLDDKVGFGAICHSLYDRNREADSIIACERASSASEGCTQPGGDEDSVWKSVHGSSHSRVGRLIAILAAPVRNMIIRSKIGRATSELQSLMRISYAVFCSQK